MQVLSCPLFSSFLRFSFQKGTSPFRTGGGIVSILAVSSTTLTLYSFGSNYFCLSCGLPTNTAPQSSPRRVLTSRSLLDCPFAVTNYSSLSFPSFLVSVMRVHAHSFCFRLVVFVLFSLGILVPCFLYFLSRVFRALLVKYVLNPIKLIPCMDWNAYCCWYEKHLVCLW